jgi:hypothetical protein
VAVYGLLLQDLVGAPAPNGAFWSIAVEAELYFLLPLMLLVRRRAGAVAVLAAVTAPVLAIGLLHPGISTVDRLTWLTPQLAPLFAMGLVAAGVVAADDRVRRLPWHWLAACAAAPVVLLVAFQGTVWTVRHYFWVDLAAGPAIAMFLAAVATRQPAPLARLLATRPVLGLGVFSYSLYLVHVPIVLVIGRKVAEPYVPPGLPAFWVTLALAVPVTLAVAWLFAAFFEIPFQRYRGWSALRAAAWSAWAGGCTRSARFAGTPDIWQGDRYGQAESRRVGRGLRARLADRRYGRAGRPVHARRGVPAGPVQEAGDRTAGHRPDVGARARGPGRAVHHDLAGHRRRRGHRRGAGGGPVPGTGRARVPRPLGDPVRG